MWFGPGLAGNAAGRGAGGSGGCGCLLTGCGGCARGAGGSRRPQLSAVLGHNKGPRRPAHAARRGSPLSAAPALGMRLGGTRRSAAGISAGSGGAARGGTGAGRGGFSSAWNGRPSGTEAFPANFLKNP